MKVLYVEDDLRDADLTVRALCKADSPIEVELLPTIEAAKTRLRRIHELPLDLVLTDMHLRDGDGLSLLKYIRENAIPVAVVVVTGMGDEETAVLALKARADDYVSKRENYLARLPATLYSAWNHFRSDVARRSQPLNVLYIEQDPDHALKASDHFAVHADHIYLDSVSTKEEALYKLAEPGNHGPYDVLLLDFELPGLKAVETLRELRSKLNQDIPVVLICSPDREELARQWLDRGATSYVITHPGYLYQLPWELEDAHSRAELLRREEALRKSEERLRLAQQAARVGTWEWDVKTGASIWSDMLWDLLGLQANDGPATLDRFVECIHPDDRQRTLAKANEVIENGSEYYDEFRIIRSDGQTLWVSSKGRVIRSEDGRAEKMIGVNIDITDRKLAEESLRNALAEVQQLRDRLHEENIYLKEEVRGAHNYGEIVGRSEALKRVLSQTQQVAPLNTTVLILGETGTGKELLAHAIHTHSPRAKDPLVKVNCAALPAPLIETELFGHVKGAFTGAGAERRGRFEIADGGTLFLDEVGELPLDLQSKLLRILEEGEFERVGSSRTISVDVRLIAATNRNIANAVAQGTFRSDLFYRLNIFPITMPPLRERRDDIPSLVTHFVQLISTKLGKEIETVPQKAMNVLQNYHWPGNVRELRNVIERAVIITQGTKLQLGDSLQSQSIPEAQTFTGLDADQLKESDTLEQGEYKLILRALKKVYWRVEGPGGAAEMLGVHPSTLRTRMRKLGISRPKFQSIGQ
jgi:formate hydrogenlyase transcriptional activator